MTEIISSESPPIEIIKVAQNTLVLLVGQIAVQISGMLLGIMIARTLGDIGYGQYTLSFAFVGIFSLLFTMGVDYLVVREIAQAPNTSLNTIGSALLLRLIGFPIVLIMTTITAWILGYHQDLRYLILLASIALGLSAFADLPRSSFRGLQRMKLDTGNRIIEKIGALVLAAVVLWFTRSLNLVIIAMSVSALLALIIGSIAFKHLFGSIHLGSPLDGIMLLKQSASLAVSLALVTIYTYLPIVFLSKIRNVHEVGLYSAAYTIVVSMNFIPQALGAAILPVLSILALTEKTRFNQTHHSFLSYISIISLPIAAIILLFGNEIILYIYGRSFLDAVPALMILALSVPFVFWSLYLNNLLIAVGGQRLVLIESIILLVVTLLINIFLVPAFGLLGTAISYVLVYGFAFVILLYFTSRWVTHKLERKVIGAVIGTISMVIFGLVLNSVMIWIRIPLCLISFILGFLSTSGMKISELRSIIKSLFILNVNNNNSL